jgi:hypothetical protein
MTCTGFDILGAGVLAGILTAARPPAGLVVPSRFMIFSAAFLRAGSRLAIAAFSAFTVPTLYRLRGVFVSWHLLTLLSWFGCLGAFFESLGGWCAFSAYFTHFLA